MLNKEQYIKQQARNYYVRKAKEKTIIKNHYQEKSIKEKQITYYMKNRKYDVMIRIEDNLARRLRAELNIVGKERPGTYTELLGCSLDEFRKHLEGGFLFGMDFNNYGKWEVDHIIPMSSFDLSDDEQIKKCCHYSNLQPLWLPENRSKGAKII